MEIVIAIDEEPDERILEVEGVVHEGSSASMNYGGLPSPGEPATFEPTHIEWHEDDPVLLDEDEEVGDPVTFYEEHDAEVHDQALEMQQARSEGRWGDHPDV